jgi:hypothetical protein
MHGPTCVFWANLTPFSRREPHFERGLRKKRGASREQCAAEGCEAAKRYMYLNSAVEHKLEHDAEQFEYIVAKYASVNVITSSRASALRVLREEAAKYRRLLAEPAGPARSLVGLFSPRDEWHRGYSEEQSEPPWDSDPGTILGAQ